MTTPTKPTLTTMLAALELLQSGQTDLANAQLQETVDYVLFRCYPGYVNALRAFRESKATEQERATVVSEVVRLTALSRVEEAGGDDTVLRELYRHLMFAEKSLRLNPADEPYKPYGLQRVLRSLRLKEDGTVTDIINAVCTPEAAKLLLDRAHNDYWRLRLLLAATESEYYFRGLPVSPRNAYMAIYTLRRGLTPEESFLIGESGLTRDNLLLIDEADRHYAVMYSGHGGAYRFDGPGDGKTAPTGPHMPIPSAVAPWSSTCVPGRNHRFSQRRWPGVSRSSSFLRHSSIFFRRTGERRKKTACSRSRTRSSRSNQQVITL
jgi:hypothetical protein